MRSIVRRIEKLEHGRSETAAGMRSGTLEEFSRRFWEMDPEGFRSLVTQECPMFSVFLTDFEREAESCQK
jgi:hypothetical protein